MSDAVPKSFRDVFATESFAHLATVDPDGAPHVTPVWVDYDDRPGHVLVNTARGRRKERNVRRDARVALSVLDPANPYRHVAIRGDVVSVTTDGADEHVDALAGQYLGVESYPNRGEEPGPRVVLRIEPDTVRTMHRPRPSAAGFARYALRRLREVVGLV